ncbi:hypothetical protein GSI_05976 [Ganoderma sinense ZZ0214-1]|uniref:T6SS Phospholipase effector Tle1-like catalytic domain-containing protein n=1 Tax=Ganoderma sinense ZZ0214-1 TaxID=1077348 RepID=A0A2G8SCG4_9APHY|nr:hypothetical protein GSI_05976 [Ganoderma sinense ZZ0214-1]
MIHKVGLLPNFKSYESVSAFWIYILRELYMSELQAISDDWHKYLAKFKELEPRDVHIDFVGVWYGFALHILRIRRMWVSSSNSQDTVPSVGDVVPTTLPFTGSNTSIRVFRQALALHEPRARLHPKFYQQFDTQAGVDTTDVQEVWFAGSHCDVGGCAVPKDTPHSLGRISLRWMVRECFRADTGIQFRADKLRDIGLDPASLYPVVKDRPRPLQPRSCHLTTLAPPVPPASEEEHDVRDALSPMHDQWAAFSLLWWVLGLLPFWQRILPAPPSEWADSRGQRQTVRMSLPRVLVTPKDNSRIFAHPTVHIREQANPL